MVATCRSSYDLTQHLCDRLASESSSNEPKVENLTVQTASLRDEFQQLEMLAKTKERNLRDERYVPSLLRGRVLIACGICLGTREHAFHFPAFSLSLQTTVIFVAYLSMACAKSLT